MHRILILVVMLLPVIMTAQDFSENWEAFYSYYSIEDLSEGNNRVYAAADNAILIYDTALDSTRTLSSVNGLAGESISAIHYSEAFQTLLIGYENGLLEVVQDNSTEVISAVDIIEEFSISPLDKRINNFMERGDDVYLSTDFGIVLYDLANLEFGDTYRIGPDGDELRVKQTTVRGDSIYAATVGGGLRFANLNSEDLIDFEEWQGITNASFDAVEAINGRLFTAQTNRQLHEVVGTQLQLRETLSARANDMMVNDNQLVVTTPEEIRVYDSSFNLTGNITQLQDIDLDYNTALIQGNDIYIGHESEGLLRTSVTTSPMFDILSPDGPLLNKIFNIESIPNELWIAFGEHNIFYNPFPQSARGISHLVGDEWTNIPYDSIVGALDLVEVTINPDNTEEVYFSAFGSGLLKLENESPTMFFTGENSNIFDFTPGSRDGSRINGTAFDSSGNLYISQGFTTTALYRISPGSTTLEPIDLLEQIPTLGEGLLAEIAIDRNDNIYIATQVQGLVGYQPSTNTVAQLKDDVGGAGLPDNDIRALKFDLNNRLWIGSTTGLRVLFNPPSIFTEDNVTVNPIIIEENGVAQELLFSQFVGDIEVDGANNKWMATAASGVFYVSPNGQETLLRFTKENSPLPTNVINDIAIDETTGRIYIGTDNGLLAYRSTATSPQDDLENVRAYPNPVRPNFNGMVVIDGLTARANVKITDITGNLVYEDTSVGGSIEWDTRAFGKHKVSSGVYLILITADDASTTQVHKLMIVR